MNVAEDLFKSLRLESSKQRTVLVEEFLKSGNSNLVPLLDKLGSDWNEIDLERATRWFDRVKGESLVSTLETKSEPINSVLQDWVMRLPLREQGTLLTCVRGCDNEPKIWSSTGVAYSPGRRLTAFIRWCFMNPADIREVDSQEGAFMMSKPPGWRLVRLPDQVPAKYEWMKTSKFKPSEFGHLPLHWYTHAMHALEIISYRHPNTEVGIMANDLYVDMVHTLHLNPELHVQMVKRLSEDRIATNTVVS